jgi:hypothetical protein
VVIDVRPSPQHDLINFSDNNENVHSLPLGEMKKLTKEDFKEKFGIKDEQS